MAIWMLILFLAITNTNLNLLESGQNYSIFWIIGLSFVYPFGIIIDNLADKLLKRFDTAIRNKSPGGNKSMSRLLILLKDQSVEEHFDYIRTRIRITRSSFLNALLITFALVIYIYRTSSITDHKALYIITALFLGFIIASASIYSWVLLTRSFYQKLGKRYEEIDALEA